MAYKERNPDHRKMIRRMCRTARRRTFWIEKVDYIGPGRNEDEEQLGRCYQRKAIFLVNGMVQPVENYVYVHEMIHYMPGKYSKSERWVRNTAHTIANNLSDSERRKIRRFIPRDGEMILGK